MNVATICLKLLLAFTLIFNVKAQVNQNLVETMMNQTIDDCKIIENATDADIAVLFDDEDWPETREGKCFMECFFEEIGIVRKLPTNR